MDDNVELWKGRFEQHKIVNRKADKTEHEDWETVDEFKFIYSIMREYEVRKAPGDTITITQKCLQTLESKLPKGPYLY